VDIRGLPAGASCLVDANIFIYHLADKTLGVSLRRKRSFRWLNSCPFRSSSNS
jgi:hypothetical protein